MNIYKPKLKYTQTDTHHQAFCNLNIQLQIFAIIHVAVPKYWDNDSVHCLDAHGAPIQGTKFKKGDPTHMQGRLTWVELAILQHLHHPLYAALHAPHQLLRVILLVAPHLLTLQPTMVFDEEMTALRRRLDQQGVFSHRMHAGLTRTRT